MTSCVYTLGHGISPGIAHLRTLPQQLTTSYGIAGATGFSAYGNLIISDGIETIELVRARLAKIHSDSGSNGEDWTFEIEDRRWVWRDTGVINGYYNQLDPHGKLIPWTIRSPQELAILCLQAMGETSWAIELPAGLGSAVAAAHWASQPPWIGIHPSATATNPPISWEAINPAQALQQLCEQFGRRIVLRISDNKVVIVRLGFGDPLPDGSIYEIAPELSGPAVPYGVAVIGAPTRYQARLFLEAVGEEWNGHYVPINDLSYAPQRAAVAQVATVRIHFLVGEATGRDYRITINDVPFHVVATGTDGYIAIQDALALQINTNTIPGFQGQYTAAAATGSPGTITITATDTSNAFRISVAADGGAVPPNEIFDVEITTAQSNGRVDWTRSTPGVFGDVRATDRLTYPQARELAKKHIWKTYRLANTDVHYNPIIVPGYGQLARRQQIVLNDTQVEQIVPEAIQGSTFETNSGNPALVNFYNGYSHDKPAAVYGTVTQNSAMYTWYRGSNDGALTPTGSQIFVPFTIDPVEQLVRFSGHVYRGGSGRFREPTLILQTAINIRNANTNSLERFFNARLNPGAKVGTPFAISVHEDMQLNVIGQYEAYPGEAPNGFTILEQDPLNRARYYLDGMQAQYITSGGLTLGYNGIRQIDCDGRTTQITWHVTDGDEGFAGTTASQNSEHSIWYPKYPARRRAENTDAVVSGRIANRSQVPQGIIDNLFRGLHR